MYYLQHFVAVGTLKMSWHWKSKFAACWGWFEAKLGSKIAPSWVQERPGNGAKSIFEGREVELIFETMLSCHQVAASRIYPPKLGLWEEGKGGG